jgi:formiminotetrahydrofolate cyclodeaminase
MRSSSVILRRMNFCTRERIVAGTLFISVVANMKITCGGGSSISFRSAFHEAVESMCASSMMKMR